MRDDRRLTRALVVAAAVVPRSIAKSLGTFATTFAPILISFSFKLVSDQSSHGEVRKKLPRL
jgi:hypothetical protein